MKKSTRRPSRPSPKRRTPTPRRVHTQAPAPEASSAIPAHAETGFRIHLILVPIDFSVHSKNALKYAIPMAVKFGAALHLVYVVEPTIYPADLGFGQVVLPGVEDELRQKGADELQALIEKEIAGQVAATSSVRTGNPHHEILSEAEEKGVDLIVVATHGHSGMEHMLFGSTADRIVRHAQCPVLTVRPRDL